MIGAYLFEMTASELPDETRDNTRFGRVHSYSLIRALSPVHRCDRSAQRVRLGIRSDKTVFEEPEHRVPVTPVSGNDLSSHR